MDRKVVRENLYEIGTSKRAWKNRVLQANKGKGRIPEIIGSMCNSLEPSKNTVDAKYSKLFSTAGMKNWRMRSS